MQIACFIQARTGSTRLPNKIHADIGGKAMLWHVEERVRTIGIPWFIIWPDDFIGGDENDVLGRYHYCAGENDGIMRITGDCPLIDPAACRQVLDEFKSGHWDYVANDWKQLTRYPDGMGCEVFSRGLLNWANEYADKPFDREHVTPWMKRQCEARNFRGIHIPCPTWDNLGKFSVDTQEDLDRIRAIDCARPANYSLAATLEASKRAKAQNLA